MIRWNPENSGVIPGLAQSWQVNADATVFTIQLRKGIRWSDGIPFTADDLVFYVNDVAKNPQLPKAPVFLSGSGSWSMEKMDDYTFKFQFEKTNALFEEKVAAGYQFQIYPAHYVKQFHFKYNPDADRLARAAGFQDWAAIFKAKTEPWGNPECPVLSAWVPKTPLQGSPQVIFERNPYYWKIDPAGNQLPYIDRIVFYNFMNPESVIQKTINGEIDFMDRPLVATVKNKSAFEANQTKGNYRLNTITDPTSNWMAIGLNQTIDDPELRKLFQNKQFRIGLSYAINRPEIIIAGATGGWTNVMLNPSMHIPAEDSTWGVAWYNWYANTGDGEKQEPVEWVKQVFALPASGYGIVSNRLRNVPALYQGGCTYAQPGASNMPQFFLK
ncbi:MAG: hypothetical protein EHM28_11050 [Spirochaetaceae bacterium]|nr:MAG: hypothetical protein EHM28_11050 [Spirochaetaceae bacterium]